MRFGNRESRAPFISFVLAIKIKLPKKVTVAIPRTDAVITFNSKLPSVIARLMYMNTLVALTFKLYLAHPSTFWSCNINCS